jgi:hypothetical protein
MQNYVLTHAFLNSKILSLNFFSWSPEKKLSDLKGLYAYDRPRDEGVAVPKGPRGERRPADTVACAVMVAKIATGEIREERKAPSAKAKSGIAGARARAENLTPEHRSAIARKAAAERWR